MVQYTLHRVIHCVLGTDSLCPTLPHESRNFTLHKGLSLEKVCEWVINFPGKCWASLTFEIDPMRL